MDQLSNFVAHSSHLAQPTPDGPPSCEWPRTRQPSTKRLNPAFGVADGLADQSHDCQAQRLKCVGMASWRCKLRQRLSCLFAE